MGSFSEYCESLCPGDVAVYNSVLSIAAFLRDLPDLRWNLAQVNPFILNSHQQHKKNNQLITPSGENTYSAKI